MHEPIAETWCPVNGYEGYYEVSDQGRVRSLDRMVSNGQGMHLAAGRVLSIYYGDRYAKVRLKRGDGGSTKNVHQLVAEAFIGPCPEGLEVCHNNGRSHDNRTANLRYGTRADNVADQLAHGTHPWAARTHCTRGHEYTPENTITRERGNRRCFTCDRARGKRRWQEELAARQTQQEAEAYANQ